MLFIVNNIQLQKRKAYFPVQVLFENSDQCPFNFAALFLLYHSPGQYLYIASN